MPLVQRAKCIGQGTTTPKPRWYNRRIRLNQGGYDPQGTYWGQGKPLYWCHNADGSFDFYIRGSKDYAQAASQFVKNCTNPDLVINNITHTGRF